MQYIIRVLWSKDNPNLKAIIGRLDLITTSDGYQTFYGSDYSPHYFNLNSAYQEIEWWDQRRNLGIYVPDYRVEEAS